MRLTPLAKAFIAIVVLAVIGFATWHYKGDAIKRWAGGERTAEGGDAKGDFDKLNNTGLSVDAEVKALDNVRQHIKTTIAEANLGKELSESSLDSRLASLRNQTGDVQAKQQLAELKAKKAAQQNAQANKTM